MLDRATLAHALRSALEGETWIRAAWEGGSAAFGRADRFSDLDLQLLVEPGRADDAFARVERELDALGGASATWRPPAAPDYDQRFYQLRDAPEWLMVDLCVMRPERLGPYLDPVRHGRPIVWFDRDSRVVAHEDPDLAPILARRMDQLRQKLALLAHLPEKELARGHRVEAVDTYLRHLVVPLVEVLRARRCPRRQDYGLRYVREDLPADVVDRLERLLFPTPETLGAAIAETRAWLEQELSAPGTTCASRPSP
jgi:hypothetical protein